MEAVAVEIDPALFTLIIQFEVDASSGAAFARELTEAVGKSIVKLTGFRTSVFQLSSDHTRVINYAQWESKEIYRSMSGLEPKDNPMSRRLVDPRRLAAGAWDACLASNASTPLVCAC